MIKEIWKPIKGYESYYEVSDQGRVRSLDREIIDSKLRKYKLKGNIINGQITHKGYVLIELNKNGVRKRKHLHDLVAEAFIPNPNNLLEVNHKDYNKKNNKASNLEWCTHEYNVKDMLKHYDIKRNFNKCIDCGKTLSNYKAIRCKYCNDKYSKTIRGKYSNKNVSKEDLKQLIRIKLFIEIGKIFGVSDNAVRKWCRRYNLPYKSTEIKKYTDEEWDLI